MEGPEEEEEDQGQCNRHDNYEPRIGPFHIFERAAPDDGVPFRQAKLCSQRRPSFIHHTADVTAHDIEADEDTSFDMLTADAERAFAHLDGCEIAHRDQSSRGRLYSNLSDACDAVPIGFGKSQDQLKSSLTFIDLRSRLPADRRRDDVLHIGHIDAEPGDLLPVDVDGQIGLSGDLFDLDVFDPRNLLQQGCDLLRLVPQDIEVVSEQLDRAFRSDTRDEFVHPFLNRLAHEHGDAGNLRQLVSDGIGQLRLRRRRCPGTPVSQQDDRVTFIGFLRAERDIRPTDFAHGHPNLREFQHHLVSLLFHLDGFRQRHAR